MKKQLLLVAGWLFLLIGTSISAQSNGPEFLNCDTIPLSLCIADDGVKLPLSNKLYLGENNPDATSCSVHLTQTTKVRSTCGKNLQYEVQIFLSDTSQAFVLQPLTTIATDSLSEAVLSFDSELSPDSFINQNGIPYTSGCDLYHRIKWIVTDSCGDESVCEKKIDLYDCNKPSLNFSSNLYTISSNIVGYVHINTDSFRFESNDDCSREDQILLSLSPDRLLIDSTTHLCEIPAWGVELPWKIWIADEGKDLDCNGTIDWNERNIFEDQVMLVFKDNCSCDCNGDYFLGGQIMTYYDEPVEKVGVTIVSLGQSFPTYLTGPDGQYIFGPPEVNFPEDFSIHAYRNDNPINGVSTLDIVRVQKHLLGREALNSPYNIIAADVNKSQHVSAIDMLEIRKLILGINTEFPNTNSWRFIPEDFIFSDPTHPWPIDEEIDMTYTMIGMRQDFIAIKIGDVNNTVQPNAQNIAIRNNFPMMSFKTLEIKYKANEWIEIPISINEEATIHGFQFTITSTDLEFIGAFSDNIDISEENYALFDDKITFSWYGENGKQFSKGDILFTLKARAKSDGILNQTLSINSDITEAEVYSMGDEIYLPVLNFTEDNSPVLFSPQPNPWKVNTSIPFYFDKPGDASFEIYDANGRMIYSRKENYSAGHHSIEIEASDLSARGLLFYSITSDNFNSTRKMILLE